MPSQHLSILDSTRHLARSPRVLRTHLHAYARRIYVTAFRTRIGLCIFLPAHPAVPPLSASCSSRQRFASGFLPIPGHPGNPCLPLTLPHVGCVEDFHLQMSAPQKEPRSSLPNAGPGGSICSSDRKLVVVKLSNACSACRECRVADDDFDATVLLATHRGIVTCDRVVFPNAQRRESRCIYAIADEVRSNRVSSVL